MTNQEILTKAIEKAIAGGWRGDLLGKLTLEPWSDNKGITIMIDTGETWQIEEFIYNKAFAKALWDEETCTCGSYDGSMVHMENCPALFSNNFPHWQYHLQNMVIADDPIKYLGENI